MEKRKPFIIGIDLHGTLLNEDWIVEPELMEDLISIIDNVKDFCQVVICTGNHFGFVEKYVPKELYEHFDGAVIETGCAYSTMKGEENSLINPEEQKVIDTLFKDLMAAQVDGKFPKMKYFGERKHSISLFTRDENEGADPKLLIPLVQKIVDNSGLADQVTVTHSSVAVDIFPKRLNKGVGLQALNKAAITIGIADSKNDHDLIMLSGLAFLPKNADQGLIGDLKKEGKKIVRIDAVEDYHISDPDVIIQATQNDTRGVIEILRFIRDNLNPNKN